MRHALSIFIALAVSACAMPYGPGHDPQTATMAREVPATQAIVLPPPGGPAVVGVIETRFSNAIEQKVVIANTDALEGENYIQVKMYGPVGYGAGDNSLSADRPMVGDIQREMLKAFPGVGMFVASTYMQNFYGPFNYAVGRRGRTTCIYGWQTIRPPVNKFMAPSSRGWLTLRVRLCRVGVTEDKLLAFLYGLTVNSYFLPTNWNPYGPAPDVPEDVGKLGAPMLPVPQGSNPYYTEGPLDPRLGRVLPPAPVASSRAPRAAVTAATAARQPVTQEPLPGAVLVPVPGVAAGAPGPGAAPAAQQAPAIEAPPALPDRGSPGSKGPVSAVDNATGFGVSGPAPPAEADAPAPTGTPSWPAAPTGTAAGSGAATTSSGIRVVGSPPAAPAGGPLQLPSAIGPAQ
ncbi:Cellulose biosynthesis protein BcsN [Pseudoxanthobacter soli DSM 19599]|uniref:Cellulose biosynthesis protein BcsN n=2 Tax=Pseudoxanthobacter TaxID=433838 RepID=A0A1M7ZQN4_9HYPH|nr:Cellulose biosynthesis protein BcsN [Pseudoxanthobacter soli DSM 19599]